MEEYDEAYREAVREFNNIYGQLQQQHNLRLHSRFSIYEDGFIEIWEYEGEQKKRRICKVTEESTIDCYKRAAEYLKSYAKEREGASHAKRAG